MSEILVTAVYYKWMMFCLLLLIKSEYVLITATDFKCIVYYLLLLIISEGFTVYYNWL